MTTDTHTEDNTAAPDDRLPLPHFRSALWPKLAELHATHRSEPVQTEVVVLDRHDRRRRRARRPIYAGAAAIAAAAAVVVVSAQRPTPDDGPQGDPELGELIVQATDQAAAEQIIRTTTDVMQVEPDTPEMNRYDEEEWADWSVAHGNIHVTYRDQDGQLVEEQAGPFLPPGSSTEPNTRIVDHADRTYSDGCWGLNGIYASPGEWADTVQRMLDEGRYYEDGTEVIDGRELLVIRITSYSDEVGDWVPSDSAALYVDPETYLTVLDRFYDEDGNLEMERRTEYLPRTPENIAMTEWPAPPSGYTEAPANDDMC